ncbi:MAG: phosphate/phosphite/phosphonate ABC transporter substrate-binding protein [Deltaproteobacteria bacterium]|nr:phosphate/phosphite/phosphonate ABC transporter substrate-binding protein [Deltaproteobacteria bacterium]
MKRSKVVVAICLAIFLFAAGSSAAETYKIGVLAKDGPVKALNMWKATADFLNTQMKDKSFEIVPLGFDEVYKAIEAGRVHFFLVNSSMFITAKVRFGATPVATMVNSRKGQSCESFGGVIFTGAGNKSIQSLKDLKGKTFMAVDKSSFGGWQMACKELLDGGVDPKKDFKKMEFGGKHENVVLAVQNGSVDAGTVRTDTLERMAAEGNIDMTEFRILSEKKHAGFPFVCSTVLYPEWPLAKTRQTTDALAKDVVEALKRLKANDKAAKDAKVVKWVDALDYSPVEDLQKALKVEAYAQ